MPITQQHPQRHFQKTAHSGSHIETNSSVRTANGQHQYYILEKDAMDTDVAALNTTA
jgi:hypothetical protein